MPPTALGQSGARRAVCRLPTLHSSSSKNMPVLTNDWPPVARAHTRLARARERPSFQPQKSKQSHGGLRHRTVRDRCPLFSFCFFPPLASTAGCVGGGHRQPQCVMAKLAHLLPSGRLPGARPRRVGLSLWRQGFEPTGTDLLGVRNFREVQRRHSVRK